MNLKQVLRGTKITLDEGTWQVGHIAPTAFPLSKWKAKRYKFGADYKWRVVKFECVSEVCRVLIVINEGKQIFRATLGIEDGKDMRVLCKYEYHASEPGWHCHWTLADHANVPLGAAGEHLKRWPKYGNARARPDFAVDLRSAVTKTAERFKFRAQGDLL